MREGEITYISNTRVMSLKQLQEENQARLDAADAIAKAKRLKILDKQ